MDERYLGDGVYASMCELGIEIYTEREDGRHWIVLEPAVFEALLQYAIKIGWLKMRSNAGMMKMKHAWFWAGLLSVPFWCLIALWLTEGYQ